MVNPSADIMCFWKFCHSITLSKRNSSKLTNKKLARLLLIVSVPAESKKSFITSTRLLGASAKPFSNVLKQHAINVLKQHAINVLKQHAINVLKQHAINVLKQHDVCLHSTPLMCLNSTPLIVTKGVTLWKIYRPS